MGTAENTARPRPTQIGDWQAAELNAAAWMRYWGWPDAVAQPGGADRGLDVVAEGALAQVKYRTSQVGRPDIQRLIGAAIDRPRAQLLFFAGSSYSTAARTEADRRSIALFTYSLDGAITAVNHAARRTVQAASHGPTPVPRDNPPANAPRRLPVGHAGILAADLCPTRRDPACRSRSRRSGLLVGWPRLCDRSCAIYLYGAFSWVHPCCSSESSLSSG